PPAARSGQRAGSQWQEPYLTLPLALQAALHYQDEILDRLSGGDRPRDHKQPCHRKARLEPVVGVRRHRLDIVREYDPVKPGGPVEDNGILRRREADGAVLSAHHVDVGDAPYQPAEDVVIEVLVGQGPDHLRATRPRIVAPGVARGCQPEAT